MPHRFIVRCQIRLRRGVQSLREAEEPLQRPRFPSCRADFSTDLAPNLGMWGGRAAHPVPSHPDACRGGEQFSGFPTAFYCVSHQGLGAEAGSLFPTEVRQGSCHSACRVYFCSFHHSFWLWRQICTAHVRMTHPPER